MNSYEKYGDYSQQEKLEPQSGNTALSIGFALLGAVIGGAVALLFAPQSGNELRGELRRTASNARNRSSDLIDNVRGKVMPFRRTSS